jgi:uncharacterized phage protein (TIGR02218 family)
MSIALTPADVFLSSQSIRLARVWTIERSDGVFRYITDHDRSIVKEGITYSPVSGFQVTTRETESGNTVLEAQGVMDDSVFKYADFVDQVYEEAKVTELTLDWKYPWRKIIRTKVFWFGTTSFDSETWTGNFEGISRFLFRVKGRRVSTLCQLELFSTGDFMCNASRTGKEYGTDTGSGCGISSVVDRNTFTMTSGSGSPAMVPALGENRFVDGVITWLTGENADAGVLSIVQANDDPGGGNSNYTFDLYTPTPYDIADTDQFSIEWGCKHTIDDCGENFNNAENHGGEAHTPGPDIGLNIERSKTN